MADSIAFKEFIEAISMAEELLEIERNYNNPPRIDEQKIVRGLRGAVAVLIVASFEQFLKKSIEEHLSRLTTHPQVPFEILPDAMKICHTYSTLERAMKGPLFEERLPKRDRLANVEDACRKVISRVLNPDAFTATGGNPSSKTIKSMLKELGIDNIFDRIASRFTQKWRKPIAHTFLPDKWDEIVNRRHVVAHTANALSISRNQLRESIKFSKILALLLDEEIQNKTEEILQAAKRL